VRQVNAGWCAGTFFFHVVGEVTQQAILCGVLVKRDGATALATAYNLAAFFSDCPP
jgi:hypothetical protein